MHDSYSSYILILNYNNPFFNTVPQNILIVMGEVV